MSESPIALKIVPPKSAEKKPPKLSAPSEPPARPKPALPLAEYLRIAAGSPLILAGFRAWLGPHPKVRTLAEWKQAFERFRQEA